MEQHREIQNPIDYLCELYFCTKMELARKTGLSYATLCSLAYGHPINIQEKTAEKLATFCKISANDIALHYTEWRESLHE